MQLFTNTIIQTTLRSCEAYTTVQVLGCGFIICHTEFAVNAAKQLGCKLRIVMGRQIGFSLFTAAV